MIKFGTDGWRSLMSDDFNIENIEKVAQAIAVYLNESGHGEKGIVIGYDTRNNSKTFADACAKVMIANGIKVYLPKRALPTPITAYSITKYSHGGAIMITASHNPAQYNGIKFIPYYAGPATEDITKSIEKHLEGNEEVKSGDLAGPLLNEIDPIDDYKEDLKKVIDVDLLKERGLKVLANPMFGAACGIFADILEEFGCEVEEIDGHPDPEFGGLTPEPIPRNMASTIEKLKTDDFDVVLAVDGDADRFGVFDSNATFIMANHALALIADYLVTVKKLKGSIVRSVATTHFLDNIAKSNGLKAVETPVGFKHIGQIMRDEPVVLGGEESAGLSILNHIPEKDGMLAGLLLGEITAYYGKSLGQVLEDLFDKYDKRYYAKRLDLELEPEQKEGLMNSLKQTPPDNMDGLAVRETIDIDGMKFILEEGSWLLARPSGTEPVIRIYLEADSTEKLQRLEVFAKSLIDS